MKYVTLYVGINDSPIWKVAPQVGLLAFLPLQIMLNLDIFDKNMCSMCSYFKIVRKKHLSTNQSLFSSPGPEAS